jgi:predicted HAD superfamily hydrolase
VKYVAFNNPVIHCDQTSNADFLKKVELGIDSLYKLRKNTKNRVFIRNVKVYNIALKLKKTGLDSLFIVLYNFFEKRIKNNLLSAALILSIWIFISWAYY